MKMLFESDFRKVGFIRKAHGVKGELAIEFEPQYYKSVAGANYFFVEISGLPVPFFVAESGFYSRSSGSALICFDWVDSEKGANRLVGNNLLLFEDYVTEPPVINEFSSFIDYRLFDQNDNELGTVTAVDNYSGNIVFRVLSNENEFLISYNSDILISVDERRGRFSLRLPEGFDELDIK